MRHIHWFACVPLLGIGLLGLLLPWSRADERDRAGTEQLPHVRGIITDIRPEDKQVTVRTPKGEELKLAVDDKSRLQLEGNEVKLDQFKKGMRVRVAYDTKDGKPHVVSLTDPLLTADKLQKQIGEALNTAKSFTFEQKEEY